MELKPISSKSTPVNRLKSRSVEVILLSGVLPAVKYLQPHSISRPSPSQTTSVCTIPNIRLFRATNSRPSLLGRRVLVDLRRLATDSICAEVVTLSNTRRFRLLLYFWAIADRHLLCQGSSIPVKTVGNVSITFRNT